jgi:glycosyltransferase involved in cell wall biosynthesis
MPNEARGLRAKWGVGPDVALIGTVGRYDPQKDYNNLLQALEILCSRNISLRCILVGTNLDDGNKELVAQIQRLGLEETIILLGKRTDIPVVMSAIDLYVLSSSSEAFPNSVAEAMACESPCVVTDVGDAAYIVGDTGWVVPPFDHEALADSIQQALFERKQSKWQQRCVSARTRIEQQFRIDRMITAYHDLWRESL